MGDTPKIVIAGCFLKSLTETKRGDAEVAESSAEIRYVFSDLRDLLRDLCVSMIP